MTTAPARSFQPLLLPRFMAGAVFGLACLPLLSAYASRSAWPWLLLPACAYAFWRCLRVGAVVSAREVVVRGYLVDRVVPRAAVTGMTAYPCLLWTDTGGRSRRTPVHSLSVSVQTLPWIADASRAQCHQLRRFLDLDRDGRPRSR